MSQILRITSRVDGFRRAGLAHPCTPVDHPVGAFSPEQLLQLSTEPMLLTTLLIQPDGEPPPPPPAREGRAKPRG